jgi:hypothetical protein
MPSLTAATCHVKQCQNYSFLSRDKLPSNLLDQSHQPISHTELRIDAPIFASGKMSKFFEMSPLSGAGKHPDFQVTSCLHFVNTDVKFDD